MPALTQPIETRNAPRTLIDALLAEERDWTAVERFSNWHDSKSQLSADPSYSRLIPFAQPKPGQQYAFEVELDKCSGCKACVTACHSLNGLDETETWRSVGLLVGGVPSVQQHVTTACHHCLDPACLSGCPVLAYEKDPLTGIVRHLDDQCIGCQYCIMKCPYEVPQYSSRLGIVRKCDMCYHRLAAGEAPACVQACPSEAIRISVVDKVSINAEFRSAPRPVHPPGDSQDSAPLQREQIVVSRTGLNSNYFLPDSPDPSVTLPTTRFLSSSRSFPDLRAADHAALKLEQPHWPLVWMLVLTQAAAGLFVVIACLGHTVSTLSLGVTAAALLVTGLTAATLHLGRPLKAWRAFLGWRTSWLSRELIAFQAFAAGALLAIAGRTIPVWCDLSNVCAAVLGVIAVFASAMVYIDTRRAAWSVLITLGNFFGTTLVLGSSLSSLLLCAGGKFAFAMPFLVASLVIRTALFVWRLMQLRAASDFRSPVHLNGRVVRELLPRIGTADAALFVISILAVIAAVFNLGGMALVWVVLAAMTTLGAELLARYVFFVASSSKCMPGGIPV